MESERTDEQLTSRVEELEAEVERLEEENRTLRDERDRAVKAQDALLEKVIPLAVPGGNRREAPSAASRVFTLLMVVLLLVAVALAAHHFPRIIKSMNPQQLPPSVRVQPPQP